MTRSDGLPAGFTPRPLAHQNGQVSLLAAAAAGARLRGLDAAGVSRAMRIATTLLLTPSYTNAVAGATTLNVAGGMSGFAGALAPELALAGFEAQPDAIEEALGQLVGGGFTADGMLDELGQRWEITRNYFRLYACCNPIHPALECLAAASPSCGRARRRSRASRSRPTVSPRSCATRSRPTTSPRNTRCRTPPP